MAQEFGDLPLFPRELFGVGEVLVLAAAAAGEERAGGGDAVGRGREDGDEVGLGKIFLVAEDAGADAFAGEREGDHDDPAGGIFDFGFLIFDWRKLDAAEAAAEVSERGDLELDLLVIGERGVLEFLFVFNHETHEIHERDGDEADSFFVCFVCFVVTSLP